MIVAGSSVFKAVDKKSTIALLKISVIAASSN